MDVQEWNAEQQLKGVAAKIKMMREAMEITPAEMAKNTAVSLEQYQKCEAGEADLSLSFIFKCAQRFGLDCALLY